MGSSRVVLFVCCAAVLSSMNMPSYGQSSTGPASPASSQQGGDKGAPAGVPGLPRGKKLVQKDGNFQLVRGYSRNGERVRYLSAERGDWEEIPAAMVDWVPQPEPRRKRKTRRKHSRSGSMRRNRR